MANPVKQLQRKSEEYQRLDKADRRRFWSDGILNNALYILMVIFIVYTAIKNKNFLSAGSIANIVSLVAASLPMALGIAGCIVLTGTDLSGGRVVGLTAAVAGALLQDRTISRKLFSNLPAITPGWILLTILIVVAIGALIGMVNGFFVAKFKLHPFIVTLGTQLIVYTLLLLYVKMGNNKGMAISGLDASYSSFITGCPDFIKTLTGGYNFEINEESSNISQGEKQLLTIARAILKDPRIIILDEATSSVDTRLEKMLQDAMHKVMDGRTSFVIAHRLSTVRNADLILVVDHGDIVEQGTHEELLAKKGVYENLYHSGTSLANHQPVC